MLLDRPTSGIFKLEVSGSWELGTWQLVDVDKCKCVCVCTVVALLPLFHHLVLLCFCILVFSFSFTPSPPFLYPPPISATLAISDFFLWLSLFFCYFYVSFLVLLEQHGSYFVLLWSIVSCFLFSPSFSLVIIIVFLSSSLLFLLPLLLVSFLQCLLQVFTFLLCILMCVVMAVVFVNCYWGQPDRRLSKHITQKIKETNNNWKKWPNEPLEGSGAAHQVPAKVTIL